MIFLYIMKQLNLKLLEFTDQLLTKIVNVDLEMGHLEGFEPSTTGFEVQNQFVHIGLSCPFRVNLISI